MYVKFNLGFPQAKAACNNKNALFPGKLDLNLRKKLLLQSSVNFCVAGTLTLR